MEDLRREEDDLKKLLAVYELKNMKRERSEGYINRVKDFFERCDDSKEKIDFASKEEPGGLLFKNIKIAPPAGGTRLQKRISFSLFEPFSPCCQDVVLRKYIKNSVSHNEIESSNERVSQNNERTNQSNK